MDTRLGCRCKYYPYSEYPVWLLLPLQHACVCEPFWYCKHGSTSRCLGRWGWWVFLPASAGWAGSLPETSSPCSVKIPIWSGKKKITNLRRLSPVIKEKKGQTSVFIWSDFAHVQIFEDSGFLYSTHRLPACFFFFFRSQGWGVVLISTTRLPLCCVQSSS